MMLAMPHGLRVDDKNFLGVVYAISSEVAADQRMQRDEVVGEVFLHCRSALERFEPGMCPLRRPDPTHWREFARYAFASVKMSMVRDITRGRRKGAGLRSDGAERPCQPKGRIELIGGEMAVREGYGGTDGGLRMAEKQPPKPDWWKWLSRRQRACVQLTSEGLSAAHVAFALGLPSGRGKKVVEAELREVGEMLIRMGAVERPESAGAEDADEEEAKEPPARGIGNWLTGESERAGGVNTGGQMERTHGLRDRPAGHARRIAAA